MRKSKKGFTLVEVMLFLGVTGLLFLGVTAGVRSSIYWQRYNDATQSFAEFLRGIYSQVMNVQNNGGGASDYAIYGKLVVFGSSDDKVEVYTLVGDADGDEDGFSTTEGTITLLDKLHASIYKTNDVGAVELRGSMDIYSPKWGSLIEDEYGNPMKGMLLVARHPGSGLVHTFYAAGQFAKNKTLSGLGFKDDDTTMREVDFCVNVSGQGAKRSDVRIVKDARSASGVEVIDTDGSDNKCGV